MFKFLFTFAIIAGIGYFSLNNYDYLKKEYLKFTDNTKDKLTNLDNKYIAINNKENNLTINEIVLNLNISNSDKANLILFYQDLDDYKFKLKNAQFDKLENAFSEFRKVLKIHQCILATKDLILIQPIYKLVEDTILTTTDLSLKDFNNYNKKLLPKIIQNYMSEFLNLIYSDALCQNAEVFKLYKNLKDTDSSKIVAINSDKKDKDLSLKDLLFGNKK